MITSARVQFDGFGVREPSKNQVDLIKIREVIQESSFFFSKLKVLHLCVTLFFRAEKGGKIPIFLTLGILLMVQKSHSQPPFGCIKPCKSWEIYHIKLVS